MPELCAGCLSQLRHLSKCSTPKGSYASAACWGDGRVGGLSSVHGEYVMFDMVDGVLECVSSLIVLVTCG